MRTLCVVIVVAAVVGPLGCTPNPDPAGPRPVSSPGDAGVAPNHDAGALNKDDAGAQSHDSGIDLSGSTPLPCDVGKAMTVCRACHGAALIGGAPMPLLTWEDTQKPAVTQPTKKVYQLIGERVDAGTMPPVTLPPLSSADKATIDAWIQAGAPAGTVGQTCGSTGGGMDGGTTMTGDAGMDGGTTMTDAGTGGGTDAGGGIFGGVGPQYLPCTPSYTFTARDPANLSQGFTVPTGGSHNYYECFVYKAPWGAGEQATAFAPIIDKQALLHHWILWESTTDTHNEGDAFICGALPDASSKFLAGWAPGGQNFVMPSNVGLHLDQGSTLLLQVHYYNPNDMTGVRDKSGVAMCTTATPRPQQAGIMAVGPTYPTAVPCADLSPDNMALCVPPHSTKTIVGTCDWSNIQTCLFGTCTPDPLYSWSNNIPAGGFDILASNPHMHLIGTKFETDIIHPDGSVQVVNKVDPFDFNEQTSYPQNPPVHVNPGDKLRTSCTYDNQSNSTVALGEKTSDEMCFDFMIITPFPTYNGGMMICPVPGLPATFL